MAMQMKEFIQAVDAVAPPAPHLEKALKYFTDAGMVVVTDLDGLVEGDLDLGEVPELPVKALIRRTIRMAIKTADAQRESTGASSSTDGNPQASAVYNTAVQ